MSRATHAIIDLSAIQHNYRYAKQLAPQSRAVAIIKANAYGHGAVQVAQALAAEADAFGVACIEEALELREAGISNPIVLLEGFFTPDELGLIEQHRLTTVIHHPHQLTLFLQHTFQQPVSVWLKMDSGMHRVGFAPTTYVSAFQQLNNHPKVKELVCMTHFACADEVDNPYTQQQFEIFKQQTQKLSAPCSNANSAAVLAWPMTHADWIRPGIMLYGSSPLNQAHSISHDLRPVMQLHSEIISIRELPAGEGIGYGQRYTCTQPTRVGVVAMGYADGYPRHAKDGTPIAVAGQRTQVIGRVSMDMLTVDLTSIPHAQIGSPVELWGTHVLANEVAEAADTISYELFTKVTRRVALQYVYSSQSDSVNPHAVTATFNHSETLAQSI